MPPPHDVRRRRRRQDRLRRPRQGALQHRAGLPRAPALHVTARLLRRGKTGSRPERPLFVRTRANPPAHPGEFLRRRAYLSARSFSGAFTPARCRPPMSSARPLLPLETGCREKFSVAPSSTGERTAMLKLSRFAAVVLLAAGMSTIARAQDEEKITVSANLVTVNVSATDSRGQYVQGLGAGQFEVFADGVRQRVAHFSSEDAPFSVGVVYDMHPTTRERGAGELCRRVRTPHSARRRSTRSYAPAAARLSRRGLKANMSCLVSARRSGLRRAGSTPSASIQRARRPRRAGTSYLSAYALLRARDACTSSTAKATGRRRIKPKEITSAEDWVEDKTLLITQSSALIL